jgi:chromosome segregation ATPase
LNPSVPCPELADNVTLPPRQISLLQAELAQIKIEKDKLEGTNEGLTNKLGELESEKLRLASIITESDFKVKQLESENGSLAATVADLNRKVEQVGAVIMKLR